MKNMRQVNANMIIMILLLSVSFMLVSPRTTSALQTDDIQLDPITIDIRLNLDGTALLTLKGTCTNLGVEPILDLDLRIESTDISSVSVLVDSSEENFNLATLERYSIVEVILDTPLDSGQHTEIELQMKINDLQSSVGSSLTGDTIYVDSIFYVRPASIYQNFTLTIYLPSQTSLSQESVSPIFPGSSGNFTDGQSMAFFWQVDEILPGQERVFIVRYEATESLTIVGGLMGVQLFALLLAMLVFGGALGFVGPRIIERIQQIGRVRFVGVTSEEEEVIAVIRAKGGSCSQKELYGELDLSQSKVSLVLTALEERGLVRRFKDGRENVVHIIEDQ